jgi:hypothetical protein
MALQYSTVIVELLRKMWNYYTGMTEIIVFCLAMKDLWKYAEQGGGGVFLKNADEKTPPVT